MSARSVAILCLCFAGLASAQGWGGARGGFTGWYGGGMYHNNGGHTPVIVIPRAPSGFYTPPGGQFFGLPNEAFYRGARYRGLNGSSSIIGYGYPSYPAYGAVYPFGYASYLGADYGPSQGQVPANPPPTTTDQVSVSLLSSQLDTLRRDLAELRDSRRDSGAGQSGAPTAAPSGKPVDAPPEPATILVFKDGQRKQIQNYAVMDNTLWDFSGGAPRRIPLSQIDIDASVQANFEQGVSFAVSNPSK